MMCSDLSQQLTQRLGAAGGVWTDADATSSSLRCNLRQVTPPMAYGRHHGPAPAQVRRAAVAIMWLQHTDGSWSLPLTMRPTTLRHHGGQVCFPGGKIEGDETAVQAAVREFEEELGRTPDELVYCGAMDPLYVYASNNLVYPVIFTARQPRAAWQPDPSEVERVIELPLDTLRQLGLAPAETWTRQIRKNRQVVGEFQMQTRAYRYHGDRIWGATAMLLHQLASLLVGSADESRAATPPLRATA